MPLHPARHPRPAQCPRQRPLWLKSSRSRCRHHHRQPCLPTLCPTARPPACPWAPPPKERCHQPLSPWCPSPHSMAGPWAPLTRQPSQDPGLLRATPGPRRGACHPGRAIPGRRLVLLALGTPWWEGRPPVLVTLSSPRTSQQEENLPTPCSPSSPASPDSPSPQCPLSPRIPLGLPLPTGFHRLQGLPGPGIRPTPGPRPLPPPTCTAAFGPPVTETQGETRSGAGAPCGLVSTHRPWRDLAGSM